jgi:two-component system, NarL family, response regulator DegU
MGAHEQVRRAHATKGSSVRVVIGGRYPVFTVGLEHMLGRGGMIVVAVATAPGELVRLARVERPAVAIIDAHSGGDWIAILPRLRSAHPRLAVIAVTGHDGAALHSHVLRLGCSSVLSIRATQDDFVAAVRSAVRGYGLVETALLGGMLAGREAPRWRITVSERDVLRCLADGLSNQQVASRLKYSVGTVKNYVHSIFEKLEAHDRTQAVVKAFTMGIIALSIDSGSSRSAAIFWPLGHFGWSRRLLSLCCCGADGPDETAAVSFASHACCFAASHTSFGKEGPGSYGPLLRNLHHQELPVPRWRHGRSSVMLV